jgi:hypothetical protein
MFGGGVLKWRKVVCLAGRSGTPSDCADNSLPNETTLAVGSVYPYGAYENVAENWQFCIEIQNYVYNCSSDARKRMANQTPQLTPLDTSTGPDGDSCTSS